MKLTATDAFAVAFRGIKVGDWLDTLLEKHPESVKTEDDGAAVYTVGGIGTGEPSALAFTVTGGKVTRFALTYTIP